jgi:hypothetical protein
VELGELLDQLEGVCKCSTGHMARCPAHDDKQQSLHISTNGKGCGVKCHAGCETDEVLRALGLTFSDLFFESKVKPEIIAEYDYTDEFGRLLYQAVRYEPKAFRQRAPRNGDWVWKLNGVRRVPYLLPELIESTGPVFIVEGEKDVHTLRVKGYTATTNAGGAGKWDPAWSEFFAGRRVFLVPDMDEPGLAHINQIAESLRDVAEVRYIQLWGAKDITEWFSKHTMESFGELVEAAELWVTPLKLFIAHEFEWPVVDVQSGLIGEITSVIEPHTEADPRAIFFELLTMFGSCIGGTPHYKVGGTYHRCNLFLAICGETARARKGSGHDWAVEVFRQIDEHFIEQCVLGGLASGEGVIHAVRDPKTRVSKKGEVEVLDEGVSDKRRLFFESELAGRTFNAMKRDGSTLSAILRQAWESSTLAVATKQNDDRATNAHISVIGHAVVDELLRTLRPDDIVGGFANRFLFIIVSRSKRLSRQTEPAPEELKPLVSRLRRALEAARRTQKVKLSEDAEKLWEAVYEELDEESTDEKAQPFLQRAAPQMLRLAMILSLAEESSVIQPHHITQAQSLWNYARRSVEFMMFNSTDHMPADQQTLFSVLERAGQPMSTTEVQKALKWNGTKLAMVKGQMLRSRIIHEETEKTTGGRPRKVLSI